MPVLVGQNVLTGFTFSDDIYGASSGEWVQQFAAVASGTAAQISIYISDWNTSSNAKLRLRTEAGDLLDEVTISSTDGTGTITKTLSGGAALTSGLNYKLSFTPDTGYLIPFNNDNGYVIRYAGGSTYATAEDPLGGSTSAANGEVAIWVETAAGNTDPSLDTPNADISIEEGESGSVDLSGNYSDVDNDTLTYSVSPALPAGLSLNTTTGVLSWNGTQTAAAATNYTFSADDGQGGTPASDVISITITVPVFSVASDNAAPADGDTVTLTVSNGTGPYTLAFGQFQDDVSVWIGSQNAGQIVINWGDIKTTRARYSVVETLVVTDTSDSSTANESLTPAVPIGYDYSDTFQLSGIHSYATGADTADNALGAWTTGTGVSNLEHGSLQSDLGGVYSVWYQDETDWVWSGPFEHTIPSATADVIPDAFDLGADVTNAEPNAATQRQFTITGIDSGETVNISALGTATLSAAQGQLNDVITVTLQASNLFATAVSGGASIGGVADSFSITTRAAVVPTVQTQPTNQTVDETQTATFTAAFTNAVSQQWYDASDNSVLTGETGTSLSINTVLADNGNTYYCIATSADGETVQTNTVTLTVNDVLIVPTVTTQPTNQSVNEGNTVTFTCAFNNAASVQWFDASDDSALTGETSTTLSFATVLADNGKSYYCVATSIDAQTVQTNTVTLTVSALPDVVYEYIPRLLTTDVQEVNMFKDRGNRFEVNISHEGEPLDLSIFNRFELFGLTDTPIDSATNPAVFDVTGGNGEIAIDAASITTVTRVAKTTLIGYSNQEPEGVVLWHPNLSQAHVTVNIINA